MPSRKEIRTITGYTKDEQLANADAWYKLALSFHEAAIVLHDANMSDGGRVFAFNAGLSLELIIKAILAGEKVDIPTGHNLRDLVNIAKLRLSDDQMHTLDLFSEIIIWRGRYPNPTTDKAWDNFHDNILQQHRVKSSQGNVHTVKTNDKRFTNKKNYIKLWNICAAEYSNAASDL